MPRSPRKFKKAGTGKGPIKGMPPGTVAMLRDLNSEKFRLREDATPAQIALAAEARKAIVQVMMFPDRHSQAKLSAARSLLEEACGKVSEQVSINEHNVTVEIRETPKPIAPVPPILRKKEG